MATRSARGARAVILTRTMVARRPVPPAALTPPRARPLRRCPLEPQAGIDRFTGGR